MSCKLCGQINHSTSQCAELVNPNQAQQSIVLNHAIVRIIKNDNQYLLQMKMGSQWVQQAPYTGDQRGLIGAMTLAIDVLAGKVWLTHVVVLPQSNNNNQLNKQIGVNELKQVLLTK